MASDRRIALIEPQIRLPFIAVLAMAVKAVLRKDRTNISVEIDRGSVLSIQARSEVLCGKQASTEKRPADSSVRFWWMVDSHTSRKVGDVVGIHEGHYGSGAFAGQLLEGRIIVKPVKVSLTALSGKALKRWTQPGGRSIFQATF
jgi:hypothetical protein